MVQIHSDAEAIHKASRACGIDTDNDERREAWLLQMGFPQSHVGLPGQSIRHIYIYVDTVAYPSLYTYILGVIGLAVYRNRRRALQNLGCCAHQKTATVPV